MRAWIAGFGELPLVPHQRREWNGDDAARERPAQPGARWLEVLDAPASWRPALAQTERCRVVFDGFLDNSAALRDALADRHPYEGNDAALVAQAFLRWGAEVVTHLRGRFALLIWDRERDLLLCARDQLGMHPLYYAEAGGMLLLSSAIDTLRQHPGVPTALNRAGLVEHLAWRPPPAEETYFSGIQRVPPGHVLQVAPNGRTVRRYWHPAPLDRPTAWIPDAEAPTRFQALLEQAVARCLGLGPAGIFLSGGLDSLTVATAAADLSRRDDLPLPWALSLAFPDPDYDETRLQKAVAAGLGLPQALLPIEQATGTQGMLAAALALSRTLPAPVRRFWAPAQVNLAREGQQRGCRVILTGEGGDDRLGVGTLLAADYVRSLNVVGAYRLWRTLARFHPFSGWLELRNVAWRFGARLVLADAWRTAPIRAAALELAGKIAPAALARHRHRMLTADIPPWLAPDRDLRRQVVQSRRERWARGVAAPKVRSYYLREARWYLDDPLESLKWEEFFFQGRQAGVPIQHPFWDVDLVELMMRVRPEARMQGGVTKSLVRGRLARRFPGLGLDRVRKSAFWWSFNRHVAGEYASAWRAMGPTLALAELGVVDGEQVGQFLDNPLASGDPQPWSLVYSILNLEAWTRAHYRV